MLSEFKCILLIAVKNSNLRSTLLKYSIIIPNYNDLAINTVIERVKLINDSEIIVIETGKQVLDERFRHDITYKFHSKKLMPGAARNEGVNYSKAENLLFVDSDLYLTDEAINFLNNSELNLENNIIFGYYCPGKGVTSISKFQNSLLKYRFVDIYRESKIRYGQSSHMIISKKNFNKIGGFNGNLRMREDTEFCYRAHILGISNQVRNEFEGIHLKYYNYYSIHKDYFLRTFHSIKVKVEQKAIFNMGTSMISLRLWFSFIMCTLLVCSPAINLVNPDFNVFTLTLLMTFFGFVLPRIMVPKIFSQNKFKTNIIGMVIFPSIFVMMILGGLSALTIGKIRQLSENIKVLFDWITIAKRAIWRNGYPIQLIQFATARCNLRCEHCFYKESLDAPNPGELDKEIFKQLAEETKPLLWYAFAGGEVFIRKDFSQLYRTVSETARPRLITIPTNGWYTEKTYKAVLEMLQQNPKQSLIIQLSIDGTQEIHDLIRGQNSFVKAMATFKKLSPLRVLYPNFQLAFITVVTPQNKHIFPDFVDELHAMDPNQININLFRYGYLDHPELPKDLVETYKTAVEHYAELIKKGKMRKFTFLGASAMRLKEIMQKELIYTVASENKFVTPCTAGTLSYVVWEDGNLGPCEILKDTNFNITDQRIVDKKVSYKELFKSRHSQALRTKIRDTKCKCTYECAMSNNTFFSWPMTREFTKRYLKNIL